MGEVQDVPTNQEVWVEEAQSTTAEEEDLQDTHQARKRKPSGRLEEKVCGGVGNETGSENTGRGRKGPVAIGLCLCLPRRRM